MDRGLDATPEHPQDGPPNGALTSLSVPSVAVDERGAGELATQHLIDLGHERIGYVAGPDYYLPTRQKAAGRESALRAAGFEPDGLVVYAGDFTVADGREALQTLLESGSPPTGVICSSDLMAIGVLQEAAARGLGVPTDLSVVGFDGIEAAAWTSPPLTTVEQPIEEIAETAVNALRSLIADPEKPLPDYSFRPRLSRPVSSPSRSSTAASAIRPRSSRAPRRSGHTSTTPPRTSRRPRRAG